MVKKVLSIAAAAAITVTGASAFDIFDDIPTASGLAGKQLRYKYDNTIAVTATTAPSLDATTPITVNSSSTGDALIFPAYYVGNGWETHLRVINTSTTNAVVAKVVFYAGNDSRELRDFNIYLSAGDVWTGTVKIDTDGKARLISTDDSSPLAGDGMASASNPMKTEPIDEPVGYVAVIGLAMAVDNNTPSHDYKGAAATGATALAGNAADMKDSRAHGDHIGLRTDYNAIVKNVRVIGTPIVFNNGVITSGANVPNVNLASAVTTLTNIANDGKGNYFFAGVANVLAGDVRITDTVNGKDMVMKAYTIQNETDDGGANCQALLIAEGEKAHLADRALTGVNGAAGATANNNAASSEYDYGILASDATAFGNQRVWMTYGDTDNLQNNMLLITSPYKRVLIEASTAGLNGGSTPQPVIDNGNIVIATNPVNSNVLATVFSGVKSANNQIVDWGYFTALALVYDESENQAQASQFSPANTPTINFHYEVSPTEGNSVATDNLSYYLSQAKGNGFDRGYVLMRYIAAGQPISVPSIATQWLATEAAGRVITNWIVPVQQ